MKIDKRRKCKICHHTDHEKGQCSNCNCGESEIITPQGEFFTERKRYYQHRTNRIHFAKPTI